LLRLESDSYAGERIDPYEGLVDAAGLYLSLDAPRSGSIRRK